MEYLFSDDEGPTLAKLPNHSLFEISGTFNDIQTGSLVVTGFLLTAARSMRIGQDEGAVEVSVGEGKRGTKFFVSPDLAKTAPNELKSGRRIRIQYVGQKVTRIF